MMQYLSDSMFDEVRGQGLTYGVSMSASVSQGRLTLSLYRSSRLTEAYKTVRQILQRYITDGDSWDETLTDSAKGSIIYKFAEKEETIDDLVDQAIMAYMRKTDSKYNREFIQALGRVQLADLKTVAMKFLPAFLEANSSQSGIVCNPNTVEDIVTDFREFGIELTAYEGI